MALTTLRNKFLIFIFISIILAFILFFGIYHTYASEKSLTFGEYVNHLHTNENQIIVDHANGQLNLPYSKKDINEVLPLHQNCMKSIKSDAETANYVDHLVTEDILAFSIASLENGAENMISNTPLFDYTALSKEFRFLTTARTTSVSNAAEEIIKELRPKIRKAKRPLENNRGLLEKIDFCQLLDIRMGAIGEDSFILMKSSEVNKMIGERARNNLSNRMHTR